MEMQSAWYLVFCAISFCRLSVQKSTPESATYVAAVVEYAPELYEMGNHTDKLSKNAEQYVRLINLAANQSADIIVFPECGLAELSSSTEEPSSTIVSSVIPEPDDRVNPCLNSTSDVHEAVRTLSCAAREHELYVVVNIPEKNIVCTESSQSNCTIYHNTNVIFDREGQIVGRYRKFNLFGEAGFDATEEPDMTVFQTDFGVKFGVFTCFDIIFEKPAVHLVNNLGITDIVFPTAWFSELPFLTAVQEQVAWARSLDVNFLGSGYNAPQSGSTGSGIYARNRVLASTMSTSPTTELLVATIPKKSTEINKPQSNTIVDSSRNGSGIVMLQDVLEPYTTMLLSGGTNQKLCSYDLCCHFEVRMDTSKGTGYKYRLAVFDGVRSFKFRTGGIQVCAIVFCANESLSSCGLEMDSPEAFSTTFDYIKITGNFCESAFPNTLTKGYEVMSADDFTFERQQHSESNEVAVTMVTNSSQVSLLTFGIYGRNFERDGLPVTEKPNTGQGGNGVKFIFNYYNRNFCNIGSTYLQQGIDLICSYKHRHQNIHAPTCSHGISSKYIVRFDLFYFKFSIYNKIKY